MDGGLQLKLLGPPQVRLDGVPMTALAYRKSLGLLVYLMVTAKPHTREALAGLLWGEATGANALAGLRKSLNDLRRRVAPYLAITRLHVAFNPSLPYWLDVEIFEQRVNEARAMLARDGALTDESATRLAGGVELYEGDFLEGFYVHQAPAFEEWVLLTQERLRLSVLRALHVLAAHCARLAAYGQSIAYTRRLLAMAPEQEEAHRQLMSLLALSGRRGSALHQYRICCRVLANELGVAPAEETTDLYERIRDAGERHSDPLAPAGNLPIPLLPLLGRDEELARILVYLQDPTCRLLTLIGPGGVGKSHLALEAARVYLDSIGAMDLADGVCFVSLTPVRSIEAMVPAIAHSLGFQFYREHEPRRQLLNHLRSKHLLLLLDNFDHLLEGATLVRDILEAAPGVKILVTSRVRLHLQSEQLLPIAGLACPEAMPADLSDCRTTAAVVLFVESARRICPDLALTGDDIAHIATICRLVDGLPLAILLAAGWMRVLTPAEIAARLSGEEGTANGLGQGLDMLKTDSRDVPDRQRSMRVVFDHSWHLLTEREQRVFAALSVFERGFTLQTAREVSGGSLHQLMSLADQSLVQQIAPGRYAIHELLRQYAEEKLEGGVEPGAPGGTTPRPPLASEVRDRHSAYYCAALQRWSADVRSSRRQAALTERRTEIANAQAAWNWAVQQGQAARMLQAMDGLCSYYVRYGLYREGARLGRSAVDRLSEKAPQPDVANNAVRQALGKALAWQGVFYYLLGQNERADGLLRQSLTLVEALLAETPDLIDGEPDQGLLDDIRAQKAFVLWYLGKVMYDVDRTQARPLYEQSLALYQALDDRWGMADALEELGWIVRYEGDYRRAWQLAEEALALRDALDAQQAISRSLRQLSTIAYHRGRLEAAERLIRDRRAIPAVDQSQAEQADTLGGSGWILTRLGEFTEGHARMAESVAIWEALGIAGMRAYRGISLAFAKVHLGQYEEAAGLAQAGLEVARREGDAGKMGFAQLVLGWVALARGHHGEALSCLRESAALSRAVVVRDQQGEVLALMGYAAWGEGQLPEARRYLREALGIAAEYDVFLPRMLVLPVAALLLADRGDVEQAVELYGLATRYPFVANSHWFEHVVGRPLAIQTTSLPPDVVAGATARGRQRDFQATLAGLLAEPNGKQLTDQ
ncbi:MAG: tetratricopeptide repeat protein [Anaerolineae bacterium]|nr:tetratricopeptide repeat protein [Anaerolineae bacterium]